MSEPHRMPSQRELDAANAQFGPLNEHMLALGYIVEWWDAMPASLRQDIQGKGPEPGCIERARRLVCIPPRQGAHPMTNSNDGAVNLLPYKTPAELFRAFKDGQKFVLHYHGEIIEVTHMQPREHVVYVQPPGLPVKVKPDGSSAEGPGKGIWLAHASQRPGAGDRAGLDDNLFTGSPGDYRWNGIQLNEVSKSGLIACIIGSLLT